MRMLLLVVLLAACGHNAADRAAPGSAAAGSSAGSAYPEVLAAQPPSVTLTAPGAEPRRSFAYAPTGGKRSATLTFTSGPEDMPKNLGLGITVTLAWSTPAAAAAPYMFVVTESKAIAPTDAKGGEAAIMGGIGAMYSTVAGRVDADAHGRATIARTTGTLPTQPSLLWLVHPLIVPLPTEPIGVGATWSTTQPLRLPTADGTAERIYTLTALDGDALTIQLAGTTRWSNGSDAVAEVVTGTLVVKPDDVLARSAHVTSTQDLGGIKGVVDITLAP